MYDNVNLWFAKDTNNNIVTIDEIDIKSKDKYFCPMCGSDLIPKAIQSRLITAHFAHIDASKCNGESMIHFWFKNKFLEPGDVFVVESDKHRQYICKEVLVEKSYEVGDKTYRPDVTILTECGNTIYFEMDYSNKKKLQDYIDIWLELKNIVVEVDIKKLMSRDRVPMFKALFYNGKCFNTKNGDDDLYYNTIGKYKEELIGSINKVDDDLKARIQKLDWLWNDVFRYKKDEVNIEYMVNLISCINVDDQKIAFNILTKLNCNDVIKEYNNFILKDQIIFADTVIKNILPLYDNSEINIFTDNHKLIFDNIFRTRDIVVKIHTNNIEFIKRYEETVKSKYWAGNKYKTYYKNQLTNNYYITYSIRYLNLDDAIQCIKEEINRQIEKSKKYV